MEYQWPSTSTWYRGEALPDGEGVGLVGQRLQRRLVDGRKEFDTARVVTLHDADVDVADVFGDRDVEIGGAEEPPIAQPGQNPALGDQDRLLDLGLVARFVRPRRQDRHAVVVGELQIAAVQARLVAVRVGDRGEDPSPRWTSLRAPCRRRAALPASRNSFDQPP